MPARFDNKRGNYAQILREMGISEVSADVPFTQANAYTLAMCMDRVKRSADADPKNVHLRPDCIDLMAAFFDVNPNRYLVSHQYVQKSPSPVYARKGGKLASYESAPITTYGVSLKHAKDVTDCLARQYGHSGFQRQLADDSAMELVYACAGLEYKVVVDEMVKTSHARKEPKSNHLAYALGSVDAEFLRAGRVTANRYVINPGSLQHFLSLPGFVLNTVRFGYVKCGEFLKRPVLVSEHVPEDEIICTCADTASPFGYPIIVSYECPLTATDCGHTAIACGVKVALPELIQKVVLK